MHGPIDWRAIRDVLIALAVVLAIFGVYEILQLFW